jgi:VanZ family protein
MKPRQTEPRLHALRKAARPVFCILACAITVLALYPRLTLPEPAATEGITHSINHVIAFSTLILVGTLGWGLRRHLVLGVAAGAIVLELAQTLSPGRQTTLGDLLASLAGVVIGSVLILILRLALGQIYRRRPEYPVREKPC